jgi:2-C-methyl-D-erythritol 4-phosphate cytidylyltransferase
MSVPRYFALIPAAGVGERMGTTMPKQYAQSVSYTHLRAHETLS